MKIFAATKKGANKAENEDRIIINKTILSGGIITFDFSDGILSIADGVGGNNAGAVASHFIANKIGDLSTISKEFFININIELIDKSNTSDNLSNMATTLSGIQISQGHTILFHVGNTRVYSLQSGRYLKQLTSDDTTVNYLLTRGQISTQDAENYDKKNEIVACFGGSNKNLLNIKISDITNRNITTFVFTSDGIHDYVSIDELEDIFEEHSNVDAVCKKVIEKAIGNDSVDDMSIMIGVI